MLSYFKRSRSKALSTPLAALFAFMPWPAFLKEKGPTLKDGRWITASFQKDCSHKALGPTYRLELAATEPVRQKGLSNRPTPLKENEGMIFVFEEPLMANFWMKETLIPLQLVYVRADGKVSQALEMPVEPDPAHPKKFYPSKTPVNAAVELAPGTLKNPMGLRLCVQRSK